MTTSYQVARLGKTFAVLAVMTQCGCFNRSTFSCPPEAALFFIGSPGEQGARLGAYPLEVQLDLLLCGNTHHHPPAISLNAVFAKHGAAAVPLVRNALGRLRQDDIEVVTLLDVLHQMQLEKRYNVANDSALMAIVRHAVERMGNQAWKDLAQADLTAIIEDSLRK